MLEKHAMVAKKPEENVKKGGKSVMLNKHCELECKHIGMEVIVIVTVMVIVIVKVKMIVK